MKFEINFGEIVRVPHAFSRVWVSESENFTSFTPKTARNNGKFRANFTLLGEMALIPRVCQRWCLFIASFSSLLVRQSRTTDWKPRLTDPW